MSDPQKYRTKDEVHEYRKDPITHVKNVLLDNKWMTADEIKAVEKEVKAEVEEMLNCRGKPATKPHELYEDFTHKKIIRSLRTDYIKRLNHG